MSFLDAISHLLNFVLPAVFVGIAVAVFSLYTETQTPSTSRRTFREKIKINIYVGLAVTLMGLLVLGVDGKIYTYLVMCVAIGSVQWFNTVVLPWWHERQR